MAFGGISFLVLAGILALGTAFVILMLSKSMKGAADTPHPSELSSEGRAAIRPLRQAVEAYEAALKANAHSEASKILGNQTRETVRQTLREASKMVAERDILSNMVKRLEGNGQDATVPKQALAKIDRHFADAADAVDALTIKVTAAALEADSPTPETESELPDLVARLQNVSKSFDEVNQTIEAANHP